MAAPISYCAALLADGLAGVVVGDRGNGGTCAKRAIIITLFSTYQSSSCVQQDYNNSRYR